MICDLYFFSLKIPIIYCFEEREAKFRFFTLITKNVLKEIRSMLRNQKSTQYFRRKKTATSHFSSHSNCQSAPKWASWSWVSPNAMHYKPTWVTVQFILAQ